MQIVVNGILTNYILKNPNQKNTLLILHGWGQSSTHWETLFDTLPPKTTILALDLPAFGQTQPLPGFPGVSDYSDFVRDFLKKLKLKNILLLGHSFGGQVATDFALRYPLLLKHLILISPANIRANSPSVKSSIFSALKPLSTFLPKSLKNFLLKKASSPNYFQSNENQKKVLNQILYQDYSDKVNNIVVPTSIIWGSLDKTIPYRGKFLAENIPNSHLYIVYGADHSPHISAATKLSDIVKNILVNENT